MLSGWWLLLVALLLLASIWLRHGLLFLVALTLLLAAAVSRLWYRFCLDGVEYRRHFSQRRALFGEEIELTIEIVNRKLLPLAWLETEDEIPTALTPLRGTTRRSYKPSRSLLVNLVALRWYERVRRHYRIRCEARGEHTFGPVQVRSGDVFGFSFRATELFVEDRLLVYPRILPITRLGLPPRDPFGDHATRDWIFEDPLRVVGLRDYVRGDNPRHIHWKATARTQTLQVKLHEATTTHHLVIFLNLHTLGPEWWWQRYDAEALELAITTAASVANWAAEHGYQVGLSGNSHKLHSMERVKVGHSRDPAQLSRILEALARTLPFASIPFDVLLRRERHELPYGATLVIVTAVLDEAILAELQALRAAGHRVALLLIDDAPEIGLRGIPTYRIRAPLADNGRPAWRELREVAVGVDGAGGPS